jgi:hypothetical protein
MSNILVPKIGEMMYESAAYGRLGCSVVEISGLSNTTADNLKKLVSSGISLCVTGCNQEKEYKALEEAGFIPLVDYKNYNCGHVGNRCRLWMAIKKDNLVNILPSNNNNNRKMKKAIKKAKKKAKNK